MKDCPRGACSRLRRVRVKAIAVMRQQPKLDRFVADENWNAVDDRIHNVTALRNEPAIKLLFEDPPCAIANQSVPNRLIHLFNQRSTGEGKRRLVRRAT